MAGKGTRGGLGASGGQPRHIPVLLRQAMAALAPRDGGAYIDATFGAGGYSRALLEAADCRVLAIDRDPHAMREGRALAEAYPGRLTLVEGTFGALEAMALKHGFAPCDGVVFDLGLSSMQLDDAGRGFSFLRDGPLDMRMSGAGPSAAELVNELGEGELAAILKTYGEERRARAIARRIVAARAHRRLARTGELAELVRAVLGSGRGGDKHPATRTFQALRIAVNDELQELARALVGAEALLRPGGLLVVVSFHSLEDRIVKQFMRTRAGRRPRPSRHAPTASTPSSDEQESAPSFQIVNPRAVSPTKEELKANPRARSATLSRAERTAAPAWRTPVEVPVPVPSRQSRHGGRRAGKRAARKRGAVKR